MTDIQLKKMVLGFPHFRGVFMRDALPKTMRSNECGIVNLSDSEGGGTHWCCYRKLKNTVYYFDSFRNLKPSLELQKYFKGNQIFYNRDRYQNLSQENCGQNCIRFLKGELPCL